MAIPVTLEFLAEELALMRAELRCIIETLFRLDETHGRLEGRLVCMRDEVQDAREAMRNVRGELSAHHRLQNTLGERLGRLEQHLPSQPTPAGPRRPRAETAEPSDPADRPR